VAQKWLDQWKLSVAPGVNRAGERMLERVGGGNIFCVGSFYLTLKCKVETLFLVYRAVINIHVYVGVEHLGWHEEWVNEGNLGRIRGRRGLAMLPPHRLRKQ